MSDNFMSKNNCTGCGACYNICPKNAITIKSDEWGFYKPIIDKEKCVNCGLCEKICPLDKYKSNNFEEPKAFALQNNDKEILYKCASGGAFAAFGKYIIEQGGVVYGVIYDENMIVCHARAENLTDLEKMLSSKYVQSNTKDTFKQAKNDLENGKTVLFSGTPCQIAGLKSFLQKDYENLFTADLVCHGVPSPLVFDKYKKEFLVKREKDEHFLNINFRSKVNGWSGNLITTITTNKEIVHKSANDDDFMKAFLSNLSINTSCLNCQFNKLPRVADVTLADFWGVDKYDKSINDFKGLSVILINSDKGNNFFNEIQNKCFTKDVPLDFVIRFNANIKGFSKPHDKRQLFLKEIGSGKSLKYCIRKIFRVPFYKRLYGILPQFAKDFIKFKILKREK